MSGIQPLFLQVFVLVPLALLAVFALVKPRRLPLAAVLSVLVDLVFFGQELLYEESSVLFLGLLLAQTVVVLALAFGIRRIIRFWRPYSC